MAPSPYLNQCWDIVNWTLKNKLHWNFNRNSNIFIQENALENVVCEMAPILSRPQWVNKPFQSWIIIIHNPFGLLQGLYAWPCRPAAARLLCSLSVLVIAFHVLAHWALGAAILIDTFTASLRSLKTGCWHQASTVPGGTADQSVILNGWNDIIIRNLKVVCEAHRGVLKPFYFCFINNRKLCFV